MFHHLFQPWSAVLLAVVIGLVAQSVYLAMKFREVGDLLKGKLPPPPVDPEKIRCVRCSTLIDTLFQYCPWCGVSQYGETLAGCIRDLVRGVLEFKTAGKK